MPQHKSAEKRVRQSKRRNARNKQNKTAVKELVKNVKKLVDKKSKEDAEKALRAAVQKLDRMAVKGVLHRNNVANKKSKLTKLVNTLSAKPAEKK
jgi:small subunit ribosomal protein S20